MYHYIIHISDIHIRWELDREEEYSLVFEKTFKLIKKHTKNETLILFTGDLIHCKTKITPVVLSLVNDFITGLSECGDVVLIAGNHDLVPGDINSKYLLDVIKRPENVTYIDKTGEYVFHNVTIGASTLADNKFISYNELKNINKQLVLAIGHYTLKEWLDDRGIQAYARVKCVEDFKGYNYACLGDIHSRRTYKNCRYAGSLIQQNFSETGKHGFSVLDINNNIWKRITVLSDYSFKNINVMSDGKLDLNHDFTKKTYVKLHIPSDYINNELTYKKEIELHTDIMRYTRNIKMKNTSTIFEDKNLESTTLSEEDILKSLTPSNIDIDNLISLHRKYKHGEDKYIQNKNKWVLTNLSFENILKYRGKHQIDFNTINGIIGISGLNASGKSSLLKILIFGLSGEIAIDYALINTEFTKTSHSHNHYKFDAVNMLNNDNPPIKKGFIEVNFLYEKDLYKIHRFVEKKGSTVSTNSSIYIKENEEWKLLKGSSPKEKNRIPEKDVNKYIYNMIGRSAELFLLNVINRNSSSLTDISDISRFNIFSNIFNLNIYSDISAKVKNDIILIRDQILNYKGRKEQIDIPINVDIDECTFKINKIEREKKILNSIRNNYNKNDERTIVSFNDILKLRNMYESLLSTREKHIKNIQYDIPNGPIIIPPDNISLISLIKKYKEVNTIEKIEYDIPNIDDLPKPLKTDVFLEDVDKLNKELLEYNYNIDNIIDKEDDYRRILAKYDYNIKNIKSDVNKINDLPLFDISPEKNKLLIPERELININKQELINEANKIDRLSLKHIRPVRHNTDSIKNLRELMNITINKLHEITDIGDIVDSLKKYKVKRSHIARLEKLSIIDDIVIEISGDLSDVNSRMKQLDFDIRYNRERDEDIKYNKRVEEDTKEYNNIMNKVIEYDKYIHNKKLQDLQIYLVEVNRRFTYIKLYNIFKETKYKYLQNISYIKEVKDNYVNKLKYESYIRYFNSELHKSIDNIDKQLGNLNYTAEIETEKNNKYLNELRSKIDAKNNISRIDKDLATLEQEFDLLEIYNKLIKEDVKVVILSRYLEQISEYINDILRNLVDFTIILNTPVNTNKVKLSIIKDNTTSSHSLSAFEDFALTLVSKVVLNIYNNNATATFLILDECLECIDYKNKDKIEDLFKMLSSQYKHIMLITHIESYYEKCDHKIHIDNGRLTSVRSASLLSN